MSKRSFVQVRPAGMTAFGSLPMWFVSVPVSAGFPSPAGDDLEDEIDPMAWVVRHPASTFWWRVEGDCLWDGGMSAFHNTNQ